MLRNHGLLTVGKTVADAFLFMYVFEAACAVQTRTSQNTEQLVQVPSAIIEGYQKGKLKLLLRDWVAQLLGLPYCAYSTIKVRVTINKDIPMQIDIMTKIVLPLALFIIMFGMGLGLKKQDFGALFISPKALSIGLSCQLLLLPSVAFVLAMSFTLTPELAIGLILVACCPGGVTSNLYTYLFKGDVALSISLTTLATFISPFTLPLIMHFAMQTLSVPGHEFALPVIKTIVQIADDNGASCLLRNGI